MPMAERYPADAELVLDDELLYDEGPRRSTFLRRDERPEDIVREGEVLAGKYRVEHIPGRSGLGVLVQVRHLELGQEVTLKFLVPEACAYPEFVQRFVREARSAVRIQGEHVARVTDVGRLESGAPYMVREYLRGPDLAEVLKVRGPLPIEEAVDYIIQASEGVAEGHALGVVHRNLRPTTLVVARRSDGSPLVKVVDFAASESLHVNPFTERAVSLVGTSAIMASLPYLAPEQIRDPHDVDFRADVYSLGAVLFELLSGTPVYAAEAAPALLAQVAADPAPAVRTLRSDIPGELDHVVLRCLAKNRAIRYASVAEFVLALQPFASLDAASSIERIVRLGKRTSKLPELAESRSRVPSPLPPAPTASVAPASQTSPLRGRHGTMFLHEPGSVPSSPPGRSSYEDVTTINPYAGYSAPVLMPVRTEPLPPVQSARPPRHTPQPPPLRTSVPPPLRTSAPVLPPLTPPPLQAAPSLTERSELRPEPTSVPPAPRSSISGMARSWAVPDEPKPPLFTQRRLVTLGAMAAGATLALVLALRGSHPPIAAVAAAAPLAAPARVEPAAVAPAPPAAAVVAPSAALVTAPATPPVAAAPPAAAPPAPIAAPVAPAPVAAAPVAAAPRPAPLVAVAPASRPAPVARKLAPVAESPGKALATAEKVSTPRPAGGGDMFDEPK